MGAKDLAEKNLLQYKDVFSDIVNVNLFGGRCYVSAEELSREPGELITKAVSDDKLRQLQMDVPMKCKKHNRSFFLCLENHKTTKHVIAKDTKHLWESIGCIIIMEGAIK